MGYLLDNFTCSMSIITKFARESFFREKIFANFFLIFANFFFAKLDFGAVCLSPMIWPWSACGRPYIYRRPRWKCGKFFVLVKIFRFCKNAEKTHKTQRKSAIFWHFFLIKNVFFIQQRSLKCIIIFHFLYRKCWFFHLKKRIILLIFFIQKTHIFYKSFCITKNVFFIDRNTIFKKKIAQYE